LNFYGSDSWTALFKAIEEGIKRKQDYTRKPNRGEKIGDLSEKYLTKERPILEISLSLFDHFKFEDDYLPLIEDSLRIEFGWRPKKIFAASFVLRELVGNAFEHGCKGHGELEVFVSVKVESGGNRLVIRVKSPGVGFNLRHKLEEAKRLEHGNKRGRGLLFVQQLSNTLMASTDGLIIQSTMLKDSDVNTVLSEIKESAKIQRKGEVLTYVVSAPSDFDCDGHYLIEEVEKISYKRMMPPYINSSLAVVISMHNVGFISSRGVGALFGLAGCRGIDFLILANLNPAVFYILEQLGMFGVFRVARFN